MDWTGCELVEVIPGKVSGRPLVKGTRVLAEAIEQYYERGCSVAEMREDYPSLSEETILRLVEYVKVHQSETA
jgi:uncharacterized protein (DUF433 family)